MKGKELKNTGKLVELLDGNHKLTIDYNAIESLEEIYGDVATAFSKFEGKIKSKDIKNFLTCAINACIENEEDHYTSFTLGKLLDVRKNQVYVDLLLKLLNDAMCNPVAEKESEDGEEVKN